MLASEIISDVRNELLEPVAGFWTDAELLNWINRAEKDFANRVRGFEGVATLSTVQGQVNYPLPANWLSAVAMFIKKVNDDLTVSWLPLTPTDLQEMSLYRPSFLNSTTNDQGTPARYFIWQNELYLDPIPDTTGDGNVKMFFKSKPVPLATTASSLNVDDTLADGVTAYVLKRAWKKEKEFELSAEQGQIYEQYVRLGLRSIKLRALNKINNIDLNSNRPFNRSDATSFANDSMPLL